MHDNATLNINVYNNNNNNNNLVSCYEKSLIRESALLLARSMAPSRF